MEIAKGMEPDGIAYQCDLDPPKYTVTVCHPDGRELKETWTWAFEPRFGTDVVDVRQMEEVTARLIAQLR